ncbi:MAG: phosphoribosylglycinamide formyltransferase [Pseudomonadota bacterium]|jgi:phosphoribosylglycinamide formyltransferase-1
MTETRPPLSLAVLISGRGSNMLAIARACAEGRLRARVDLVLADVADAAGLASARAIGLDTRAVDAGAFRGGGRFDKPAFEAALAQAIEASGAELVVLAGFMRVLSPAFVERFAGRLLNIHPSLLPAWKGLHTHERVLAAGDAEHGATVHFVTGELDGGPLLLQGRVPVLPGDDVAVLSARVQRAEHSIYPQVIDWIAEGRLTWSDGVPWLDGAQLSQPLRQAFC